MNKEEILSRSRKENKDQDLYAMEVQSKAGTVSSLVALALATVFFVIEKVTGGPFNFGLYAIVFSIGATSVLVSAICLKKKRDIILAAIYTLAVIVLAAIHIYRLLSASAVI